MIKENEKVCIGWIDGGNVYSGFIAHLSTVMLNRSNIISDIVVSSGPYLSLNRNKMVESFLQTDAEWLFSIDTDVCINVEDFDKIIESADSVNRPIVAGKYYIPFDDGKTIIVSAQKIAPPGSVEPSQWLNIEDLNTPIIDGLHSVGIGYCLIHRDVFQAIQLINSGREWPWFKDEFKELSYWKGWSSDDIYFWDQVRSLGINIALCADATSQHLKSFKLTDSTYLAVNGMQPHHNHAHESTKRISWWTKSKKQIK